MLNKDIIYQKFHLKPTSVVIPKYGKRQEKTVEDVIDAIYNYDKDAANKLGLSVQSFRKYLKTLFPELNLRTMNNRTWESWFLSFTDSKRCCKCKEIVDRSLFSKDRETPDGLKHECKNCVKDRTTHNPEYVKRHSEHNKIKYQENLEENRAWRRQYYQDHKEDYKVNNAKRRAAKLQAIPKWASLSKIRQFYLDCPKGYEVDHIIPLQNDTVCGLHVINNLQYLTVSDNRSKGNSFNQEGAS